MDSSIDSCLYEIAKKKGKHFDIYISGLNMDNNEVYLQDTNVVIYCGNDLFVNIFSFEGSYFDSQLSVNVLHFIKTSTPCFFNSIPLRNIMAGLDMPSIKIITRNYGVLEEVQLLTSEEHYKNEKLEVPRCIALIFTKKILCFSADTHNTNQTNYYNLFKEEFDKFIKNNNLRISL